MFERTYKNNFSIHRPASGDAAGRKAKQRNARLVRTVQPRRRTVLSLSQWHWQARSQPLAGVRRRPRRDGKSGAIDQIIRCTARVSDLSQCCVARRLRETDGRRGVDDDDILVHILHRRCERSAAAAASASHTIRLHRHASSSVSSVISHITLVQSVNVTIARDAYFISSIRTSVSSVSTEQDNEESANREGRELRYNLCL